MTKGHPVTPYEEQLEKQVHKLEEELEQLRSLFKGEICPEATCAFCRIRVRFRVHFNTQALPTYLQCPECLAPHRLPAPIS